MTYKASKYYILPMQLKCQFWFVTKFKKKNRTCSKQENTSKV